MIIIPLGLLALANRQENMFRLTFVFASLINASVLIVFRDVVQVRLMVITATTFSLCFNFFVLRLSKCRLFLTRMEMCLLIVMRLTYLHAFQFVETAFGTRNEDGGWKSIMDLPCVKVWFVPVLSQACLGAIGHLYLYFKLYTYFSSTL